MMADPEDIAWTAEAACMNAWPSPRQMLVGDYLLRASGGPTKRTNSVNPLRASGRDPAPVIDACETIYAGLGRPALFRVPSLAPAMAKALERRGYAAFGESVTLLADLADRDGESDPVVSLIDAPDEAWLAARSTLNRADAETDRVYRAMTGCILLPKVFAAVIVDGAIASMAYAAVDGRLAVIESVGTLAPMRGRGFGRRVVGTLMRWGRERGAAGACLQVQADNAVALALYRSLGFTGELSRYDYYRKSPPAA